MGRYVTYIDPTTGLWRHGTFRCGAVIGDDGMTWSDLPPSHIRPAVRLVRGFEAQYREDNGRWVRVDTLRVQLPVATEQGTREACTLAYALLRDHYGLSEGGDDDPTADHTGEEPPFAEVRLDIR